MVRVPAVRAHIYMESVTFEDYTLCEVYQRGEARTYHMPGSEDYFSENEKMHGMSYGLYG